MMFAVADQEGNILATKYMEGVKWELDGRAFVNIEAISLVAVREGVAVFGAFLDDVQIMESLVAFKMNALPIKIGVKLIIHAHMLRLSLLCSNHSITVNGPLLKALAPC